MFSQFNFKWVSFPRPRLKRPYNNTYKTVCTQNNATIVDQTCRKISQNLNIANESKYKLIKLSTTRIPSF